MKIGIAGPIQTEPLKEFLNDENIGKTPEGLGGTPVTQLVKGLLKAGHTVSVYSLDFNVNEPKIFKGERLTLYFGPYRQKHRIWNFFKQEREILKDFILEDRPDLVHAHWTYEFALGALASKYPTLITVRDWAPAILRGRLDHYRIGRLLMALVTFHKGSHFAANSPYIQNCLNKYLRIEAPVIANALDEFIFYKDKKSLSKFQPLIISINNGFSGRKNVKSLIRAFSIIKKKVSDCRLVLIGDNFEEGGEAYKWAKGRCIAGGIEFKGFLKHYQTLKILETSDILIHPAIEESFCMTLLEAMAKKVPVIGGINSGAVPWVLNFGKAGILTDINSPELIANETIRLMENKKLWQGFSIAGYHYAWDNFRLMKIVTQTIREYKKVLGKIP